MKPGRSARGGGITRTNGEWGREVVRPARILPRSTSGGEGTPSTVRGLRHTVWCLIPGISADSSAPRFGTIPALAANRERALSRDSNFTGNLNSKPREHIMHAEQLEKSDPQDVC